MNIKDFTQNRSDDSDEVVYADSFRRSLASAIDLLIVLALRCISILLMGVLYLDQAWKNFFSEFYNKFGTETIKKVPEHINFISSHQTFYLTLLSIILIILVGAVYHAVLNSSTWQATIGKRIANIIIVKESNKTKISFSLALCHYFLSIAPFVFVAYVIGYQIKYDVTFFEVITTSSTNLFFGILFIAWVQIHLFTKKKTTAYDLICKTVIIKGTIATLLPWNKVK